jgi:S1-C subfamily serine protease
VGVTFSSSQARPVILAIVLLAVVDLFLLYRLLTPFTSTSQSVSQLLIEKERLSSDLNSSCDVGEHSSHPSSVPNHAGGTTSAETALIDKIRTFTVRVLSERGSGTGVFIGPKMIITNRHVIEGSGNQLFVTSKSLGVEPLSVRVLAATRSSDVGEPDFALLELNGSFASSQYASLADDPSALKNVVAAGYPGAITDADADRVTPEVVVSTGVVQVVQQWEGKPYPVIVHTAPISPGSSGGGLFDRCGNLLGLNTFIKQDAPVYYALTGQSLRSFLDRNGHVYVSADRVCEAG